MGVDLLGDLAEGDLLLRLEAELHHGHRLVGNHREVQADHEGELRVQPICEDHRIDRLPVLDLDPVRASCVELVGGVLPLGDDTFEIVVDDELAQGLALPSTLMVGAGTPDGRISSYRRSLRSVSGQLMWSVPFKWRTPQVTNVAG